MTETAKIAANNSYQRALAEAEMEHADATNTLLQNYYGEKTAKENAAYADAMNLIESGRFNTTEELDRYINGYKDENGNVIPGITDSVSEEQGALLNQQLDYYKGSSEQKEKERELDEYNRQSTLAVERNSHVGTSGYLDKLEAGNNFKIGSYKVELGEIAEDGVLPSDKVADIEDGEVFAYDGVLYIKKAGNIYTVRGRGDKATDDYSNALALFSESGRAKFAGVNMMLEWIKSQKDKEKEE